VTDALARGLPEWKQTLEKAARSAGHEARNALNGLVVSLEVVRAKAQGAGFSAEPFMTQAVAQSEESVRLTEATIALLNLVVGAIGPDGRLGCDFGDSAEIHLDGGADSERILAALQPLSDRGVLNVERSGPTVILRIPQDSHD